MKVRKKTEYRRLAHSEIERRRRAKINMVLAELRMIIPSSKAKDNNHQLSILENAIEYIDFLHHKLGITESDLASQVI
ncbi:hypothetical protein HK103_000683 [Boothiomyces macroporosus]|uniref:BHLH domain-containing protein n=1 Tax=Boothiomyces macroporosus TaxID=261099 RepID=A0AAD5UB91_9FUNG|nr:hypothetical protein HK103_000683 [Boothiomyces macroporosus]